MKKKVFVSGCFDLLHSGHVAFLRDAAQLGDVYVGVASDKTVEQLKKRRVACSLPERLYMLRSLSCVKEAFPLSGSGRIDFHREIESLRPDIFLVNTDGDIPEKKALCAALGIQYIVREREPPSNLPPRSTTELLELGLFDLPYRITLAGAWLDQPFLSKILPGWVICAQIQPTHDFFERGGLATSTRECLSKLLRANIHTPDPKTLAQIVFRVENGIDKENHAVSGAQDAIGICCPGITFQYYSGKYWPQILEQKTDDKLITFLENTLSLYPTAPRAADFDPLQGKNITREAAQRLAESSVLCRTAILTCDEKLLARALTETRLAQTDMFPAMFPGSILEAGARLTGAGAAWNVSGAGGGGYIVCAGGNPSDTLSVRIGRAPM